MTNNQFVDDLYQMKQWLAIKHHIPGRIRIKFSLAILTKVARFNQFKSDINQSPLIKDYQINMTTGSLLVEYDHQIIPAHLLDTLLASDEAQACHALQQLTEIVSA